MASHDSDSSDGEEDTGSFVTTNVLLGYASNDEIEDNISQLGGKPSWLFDTPPAPHQTACQSCHERMPLLLQLHADLPDQFPGHDRRLHVFGCRRKACRRKAGSIRVLRSTRVDPSATSAAVVSEKPKVEEKPAETEQQQAPAPSNLGSTIFGGTPQAGGGNRNPFALGASASGAPPNPFSLGSIGSLASKPAQNPISTPAAASGKTDADAASLSATFAAKAKIGASSSPPSNTSSTSRSKQTPAPPPSWTPGPPQPPYRSFFLDAAYEELGSGPPAPDTSGARMLDIEEESTAASSSSKPSRSGGGGGGGDDYESAHDRTFQRFSDRIWHNPEQVLRYEFGGAPLLFSREDDVGKMLAPHQQQDKDRDGRRKVKTVTAGPARSGMPACGNCGAQRTFECQITSRAILELETDEEAVDGMEWGTVIVGVCTRDCEEKGGKGEVGYVDEWAGVQWE